MGPHSRGLSLVPAAVILIVATIACSSPRPQAPPDFVSEPVSFEGDLPCADCPVVKYHLDLQPGGEFLLRTSYGDRPEAPDSAGRWTRLGNGDVLQLEMEPGQALRFAILESGNLRQLDIEAVPVESALNYELERLPTYLPVLATQLPDPTWRLTHLHGNPLGRDAEAQPVTLRFDASDGTVAGSTGCNNFNATYSVAPNALTFGSVATTRLFCPDDAELETRVLTILEQTRSHRIVGNLLELHNESGRPMARYTGAPGE